MNHIISFGIKGLFFCVLFFPMLFQRWQLNTDVWFILKSGEYVMNNGIPHFEPLSMHEGLHFVLEQWLTDIIFWNVFNSFGAEGLFTLTWIIGGCLLYLYYKLCLLVSDNNKHISFILTFFIGISVSRLFITTRPQIFSALILIAEVLCIEKFVKTEKWKYLIPLPILSIFMVNLHAALWPMMFVVILPYMAAYLLGIIKPSVFEVISWFKTIFIMGIIAFCSGFCNPYGWEAMTFSLYSYDPEIHNYTAELQPATLKDSFSFFLFTALCIVAYSRYKVPIQYVFLSCGTAFMGFLFLRNEFLFFIIGTFPLAYVWKTWQASFMKKEAEQDAPQKMILIIILILIGVYSAITKFPENEVSLFTVIQLYSGILFLSFLCFFLGYKEGETRFDYHIPLIRLKYLIIPLLLMGFLAFVSWYSDEIKDDYGETLRPSMDFLLENKNPSDIILWNGFNSGAYVEYRGIRSYIDARPEVFAPSNHHGEKSFIKEYFDTVNGDLYYKDIFNEYGMTHILAMPSDGAVYLMLPHDPDYEMIFEQNDEQGDVICRIFVPVNSN